MKFLRGPDIDALMHTVHENFGDPIGVLCVYCFSEVKSHAHPDGRRNILMCGCFGQAFPVGHERFTQETWAATVDAGRRLSDEQNQRLDEEITSAPIVNPAALGCWCPSCSRDRRIAATGIWLAPDGQRLVAKYGICRKCTRRGERASEKIRREIIDHCEAALLRRYPFLQEKLCPNP